MLLIFLWHFLSVEQQQANFVLQRIVRPFETLDILRKTVAFCHISLQIVLLGLVPLIKIDMSLRELINKIRNNEEENKSKTVNKINTEKERIATTGCI